MTRTKTTDIKLKEAQAKYTKLKAANDGTAKAEKAYRKSKTDLAMARQAHAETKRAPNRPGDASAKLKSVATKAGVTKPGAK